MLLNDLLAEGQAETCPLLYTRKTLEDYENPLCVPWVKTDSIIFYCELPVGALNFDTHMNPWWAFEVTELDRIAHQVLKHTRQKDRVTLYYG